MRVVRFAIRILSEGENSFGGILTREKILQWNNETEEASNFRAIGRGSNIILPAFFSRVESEEQERIQGCIRPVNPVNINRVYSCKNAPLGPVHNERNGEF